jgi:hypothetical protein
MAEISDKIELSEGDLVMTFNKTIDLLRQVGEMLQQVTPEPPARRFGRPSLLKRDIVEHSLVLGFAPIELPEIARAEIDAARAETPPARKPRSESKAAAETVAEPQCRRSPPQAHHAQEGGCGRAWQRENVSGPGADTGTAER